MKIEEFVYRPGFGKLRVDGAEWDRRRRISPRVPGASTSMRSVEAREDRRRRRAGVESARAQRRARSARFRT